MPLAGRPLAVLGVNRHHELVYQLGLQLLFSGKPLQAFDCLLGAVQVFRTNPRIWHRLAEACVASWQLKETELVRWNVRTYYVTLFTLFSGATRAEHEQHCPGVRGTGDQPQAAPHTNETPVPQTDSPRGCPLSRAAARPGVRIYLR